MHRHNDAAGAQRFRGGGDDRMVKAAGGRMAEDERDFHAFL
jgi:hypothetical protein